MAHKIIYIYIYTIKKRLYITTYVLYYTGKIIKKHIATLFTLRPVKNQKNHTHTHTSHITYAYENSIFSGTLQKDFFPFSTSQINHNPL